MGISHLRCTLSGMRNAWNGYHIAYSRRQHCVPDHPAACLVRKIDTCRYADERRDGLLHLYCPWFFYFYTRHWMHLLFQLQQWVETNPAGAGAAQTATKRARRRLLCSATELQRFAVGRPRL